MAFSVEMLLKLVDQASGPLRAVVDKVKGLEDATKAATGAAGAGAEGWKKQKDAAGAVVDAVKKVEDATKQATGATGAGADGWNKHVDGANRARDAFGRFIGAGQDGWRRHTDGANNAGDAADRYGKTIDRLMQLQANYALSAQGFKEIANTFNNIRAPILSATDAAIEFQRVMGDLKSAGIDGSLKGIGDELMAISRSTGIDWKEIAEGRRAFFAKGGGGKKDDLAPVEAELATFAKTAGADMADVYKLFLSYVTKGLAPRAALDAMRTNFSQGKAGAFELKNMAKALPELAGSAITAGMTPEQAARDLPALVQLPAEDMTPERSVTVAKQFLADVQKSTVKKKIGEQFGVDANDVMRQASASGANPLFALMNAITDKFKAMDPTAGAEALGNVFGSIEAKQMMEQWIAKRDRIKDYLPGPAQVASDIKNAEETREEMGVTHRERAANQKNLAQIELGQTQIEADKASSGRSRKGYSMAQDAMKANPNATSWGASIWNTGAAIGGGVASAAAYWQQALLGVTSAALVAAKYPAAASAMRMAGSMAYAPFQIAGSAVGGAIQGVGSAVNVANTLRATQSLPGLGTGAIAGGVAGAVASQIPLMAMGYGIDGGLRVIREANEKLYENVQPGQQHNIGRDRRRAFDNQLRAETAGVRAQVDGGGGQNAVQEAQQNGEAIKSALSVTARPEVDASGIRAATEEARALNAELARTGSLASQAAAAVAGARRSTGALHDGYETR